MESTEITSLTTLTESEAVALLATQEVGRLVYTRRALPAVTPVNYALRDGAIWIWTASASSMAQAVRGAVVAFETDQLDAQAHTGWSVLVLGIAELVLDKAQIERACRLGPEPWVHGRKEHLIRIPLKLVTGRRILPAPSGGAGALRSDEPTLAKAVS
jgi:nitroimidazol reductase NimA-like FMN-containing flavoprotein (pyridoxamine 5'-phosphate oxidase superfamily)